METHQPCLRRAGAQSGCKQLEAEERNDDHDRNGENCPNLAVIRVHQAVHRVRPAL